MFLIMGSLHSQINKCFFSGRSLVGMNLNLFNALFKTVLLQKHIIVLALLSFTLIIHDINWITLHLLLHVMA